MNIKTANKNDIVKIYELYEMATAYQKTVSDKQWEGFEQALIEKEIEENRLWKIYNDNQFLCVFSINFNDKLFWGEKDKQPSIYIHRIALNTNFKGLSIMTKIIYWAKSYCVENEKQFIRMDTWGENTKLIDYYKKCGFEHIETIDLGNTTGLPSHYKGKLALLEMKINEK
jgi:ribosomal protein S18 acetylase RimI-like enzyme